MLIAHSVYNILLQKYCYKSWLTSFVGVSSFSALSILYCIHLVSLTIFCPIVYIRIYIYYVAQAGAQRYIVELEDEVGVVDEEERTGFDEEEPILSRVLGEEESRLLEDEEGCESDNRSESSLEGKEDEFRVEDIDSDEYPDIDF